MANRRSLESQSNHHVAVIRNTYFQFKTLLLTLAFVSLLISIHCASFGGQSVNQQHQQWHNRRPHEYNLYSEKAKDDANFEDLLNYAATKQLEQQMQPVVELNLNEREQSMPKNYYLASSQNDDATSSSNQENLDHLYRKLLLANQPNNSPLLSFDYPSANSDSLVSSNNNDAFNDELSSSSSSSNDATALNIVDQLLREEERKQLSHSSSSSSLNNYYNDDAKNSLYLLPDQPISYRGNDLDDKITLNQQDEQREGARLTGGDERDKLLYKLSIEDGVDLGDSSSIKINSNANEEDNHHRNLTTLLEDEQITTERSPSGDEVSTKTPQTQTKVSDDVSHQQSLKSESSSSSTTEPSYGSVVTASFDSHDNKTTTHKSSVSSMFKQLYNKLASYMPNFMNFSQHTQNGTGSAKAKEVEVVKNGTNNNKISKSQSVSGSRGPDNSSSKASDGDDDEDVDDNNNSTIERKQQTSASSKTDSEQLQADSSITKALKTFMKPDSNKNNNNKDEDLDNSKLGSWNLSGPNGGSVLTDASKRQDTSDVDDDFVVADNVKESAFKGNRGHKISMLRQSSSSGLVGLPVKFNDELIIQSSDESTRPSTLLGKYIYAPEHHYHLNTIPTQHEPSSSSSSLSAGLNSKRVNIDDEQQMYTQMSQRSYLRRLHPGDSVYSSYSGSFNPLYESHGVVNQPLTGIVTTSDNKTNDVYFLVMVAAFCAMAMAVVLAAGLFAYRVQQNRKATTETDYPTYGVVGPNNMNGKCGAASFVGGYFGAAGGGPGSSSTLGSGSSKTGSVKQMADLYCGDSVLANGNGSLGNKSKKGSCEQGNANNGGANNRSNFMQANQNAARMYHYQHQKQQMIISDRASAGRHTSASDLDSEDENDDGTYTVYECPGLASAHEMEIKNPLFNDDQTP